MFSFLFPLLFSKKQQHKFFSYLLLFIFIILGEPKQIKGQQTLPIYFQLVLSY